MLKVILISLVAGVVGTGLGGVISCFFKKDSSRTVSLLLAFAGGVMIAVVFFDLLSESIVQSESIFGAKSFGAIITVIGLVAFGFGLIALLNYFIDKKTNREVKHTEEADHPKTADDLDELIHSDLVEEHRSHAESAPVKRRHLFYAGVVMAIAIALHNLPEGMAIGSDFAASGGEMTLSGGLALALVIGLHNIPEGMAVAVPLISGGEKKWKAVFWTASSGLPTVLGAIIGYSVFALGAFSKCFALSFSAGAMLYVVFGELLPESTLMFKSKLPSVATMTGIFIGILIIFL